MTKIKICGITRVEDARFAVECGADVIGMIFVRESPRFVEPEQAARIRKSINEAKVVGVFRDDDNASIRDIAKNVGLDFVQLHGGESDDDIVDIGVPVIK